MRFPVRLKTNLPVKVMNLSALHRNSYFAHLAINAPPFQTSPAPITKRKVDGTAGTHAVFAHIPPALIHCYFVLALAEVNCKQRTHQPRSYYCEIFAHDLFLKLFESNNLKRNFITLPFRYSR